MTTRRLTAAILVLLAAIQIATSSSTITLLDRMAPAVSHILEANVASVEAAETMLAAFVASDLSAFEVALRAARENVTEEGETATIARIDDAYRTAFAGDSVARRDLVGAVTELGRINRLAMGRADLEARRLGRAGAWAAVLLAAIGLAATIAASRALGRRVLEPLDEVSTVVRAQREGQRWRRCVPKAATRELDTIMHALDDLLDMRDADFEPEVIRAEHIVLVHLLDAKEGAWVACDAHASVLAANREGLDRLSGDEGATIRASLRRAIRGEAQDKVSLEKIGEAQAFLCRLAELPPALATEV